MFNFRIPISRPRKTNKNINRMTADNLQGKCSIFEFRSRDLATMNIINSDISARSCVAKVILTTRKQYQRPLALDARKFGLFLLGASNGPRSCLRSDIRRRILDWYPHLWYIEATWRHSTQGIILLTLLRYHVDSFYPSAFRRSSVVACVRPSVRPSVHPYIFLVRTITRYRFELETPNLPETWILGYSLPVLKMEDIARDLQGHFGNLTFKF